MLIMFIFLTICGIVIVEGLMILMFGVMAAVDLITYVAPVVLIIMLARYLYARVNGKLL